VLNKTIMITDCQTKDRSSLGQDHANWCDLDSGEEDLNWIVAGMPGGKGLGVVSMTSYPRGSRILVDRMLTRSEAEKNPRFADLEPSGGTTSQKFDLNCIGSQKSPSICLKIARVNHSCSPNASYILDEKFKVGILFAERDIIAGEEITVSYISFKNLSQKLSAESFRQELNKKWAIDCPAECDCRDTGKWQQYVKARAMDQQYVQVFLLCRTHQPVLETFKVVKLELTTTSE
jgi:hypothetical protein